MSKEATTKARQKRKEDLVYVHGGKCAICGYNRCIGALQFHHINPDEKEYGLSSGNCHSWENDIKESKKCILVCSNCHQEIHMGLITDILKTSFNQEKCDEKSLEKLDHPSYCKNCGKKITTGANYCKECWPLIRRKAERPSREELKQLIRTKNFCEIGREFGLTDNAIRKWCDGYSLPRRKTDINKYTDEEWKKI